MQQGSVFTAVVSMVMEVEFPITISAAKWEKSSVKRCHTCSVGGMVFLFLAFASGFVVWAAKDHEKIRSNELLGHGQGEELHRRKQQQ